MSSFVVSARKYRPDHFSNVLGQRQVTETLQNAIKRGQLAQSFLFCGPRGVGKTSCARILAKTINCTQLTSEVEACGVCESCLSFQNGNSFNIQELDAASNNSVEDIRGLVEQIRYAPQSGKYKIYIIDEVHMLSQNAFNAFLKTLEEPPSYVIFILATTEKFKIIPTILSRCQIFDFNRITVKDAADHLAFIADRELIDFEPEALHLIAQKSDGAMRDALSMFDQIAIFTSANITYQAVIQNLHILDFDYYFKITECILEENIPGVLLLLDEILQNGFNGNDFLSGLSSYFRDLLVCKDESTVKLLEVTPQTQIKYLNHSQRTSASFLLSALNLTNQAEIGYRTSKNQRLQVELVLLKLCHISSVFQFQNYEDESNAEGLKKKRASPPGKLIQSLNEVKHEAQKEPNKNIEIGKIIQEEFSLKSERNGLEIPKIEISKIEISKIEISKIEISKIERPELIIPKAEISNVDITEIEILERPQKESEIRFKIPNRADIKLAGQKDLAEIKIQNLKRNKTFTSESLANSWKKFLITLEKKEEHALYSILSPMLPILGVDNELMLTLQNSVHKNLIQDYSSSLLEILHEDLENDLVFFSYQILTTENEAILPFTALDKFNYLASINPLILELKNKLGLEIDY